MPEPNSKETLLNDIHRERDALQQYLAKLPPEGMEAPGAIAAW